MFFSSTVKFVVIFVQLKHSDIVLSNLINRIISKVVIPEFRHTDNQRHEIIDGIKR